MKFSFFALLLVLCLPLCAQKTTTTKTTTKTVTNSGEYIPNDRHSDVTTNNGKVDSYSSTNRSSTSLTFTSDFKAHKQASVKNLLLGRLDNGDLTQDGDVYRWRRASGGETYFSCSLSEGQLRLSLDRTVAPRSFYNKIDALCNDIVEIISSHERQHRQSYDPQLRRTSKTTTTNDGAEAELQRALQELNAAREKVERLGKKVDKERKNN